MFLHLEEVRVSYPRAGFLSRKMNNARAAETTVVNQVHLQLAQGEIGVLIGPSGCGKTTLLRTIAGLQPINQGHITLGNTVLSTPERTIAPEKRSIGMVFQNYALFPHMTVAKNIAFGVHKLPQAKQTQRVQEMLELVDLTTYADRYPHELSGGQQQRVALARALAPQPSLLLLDEPFSNLDVDLREKLAQELRNILKTANATALFVTHDQQEAFAIGDVIGVMNRGELHQWADAYTLYHEPETRFVAEFIGHGTFAPARFSADGKRLITPLGTIPARDAKHPPTRTQTNTETTEDSAEDLCEILIRADDIVHDDDAPSKAKVVRKAFRGNEFLYTLELRSGQHILAHVPSHHDHAIGEWIGIRVLLDHVVTFTPTKRYSTAELALSTPPPMPPAPNAPSKNVRNTV